MANRIQGTAVQPTQPPVIQNPEAETNARTVDRSDAVKAPSVVAETTMTRGAGGLTAAQQLPAIAFDGTNWDYSSGNPPWTLINDVGGHPNGTNNATSGGEQWAVRRYVADMDADALEERGALATLEGCTTQSTGSRDAHAQGSVRLDHAGKGLTQAGDGASAS